ncbi:MAG: metal-sensitive transcriptional regulator [Rubrobacteraceae bacterium]
MAREELTTLTEVPLHGYIKADHKDKLENRLKRIEGQVRGVQRMVDEEAYCIDILTQISSLIAASEKVAAMVLRDHVEHCVKESIQNEDQAEEKIDELVEAVERFLKV